MARGYCSETIWLTPEDQARIVAAAANKGISKHAWMVQACLEKLAVADQAAQEHDKSKLGKGRE